MTNQQSKLKEGYKQTEVGVIPEDWEIFPLGELFLFSGGYTASRDQLSGDGFCYLHYGDIHKSNKTYINVKNEYQEIPKLNVPIKMVSQKSLLNDGDVVFVDASEDDEGASKHIVVQNQDEITYISGLHTIVSKSKNDYVYNGYKQHCFQTADVKRQFKFYAVGTKVSGINKANIAKIQIPLPPTKAEQTAIATALSDADTLIQSLEKLIAKKRLIKQGAMQELLKPKEGWVVKKLGEMLFLQGGFAFKSEKFKESGLPIVRISNINDGYIDFETVVYYGNDENIPNEFIINKADTLIAMSGATTGKVGVFNQSTVAYQNQRVGRFDLLDPIKTDKAFIHQLVCSTQFKRALTKELEQGAQPNISAKQIESLEFIVPIDKDEQTRIATILSDMDAEISAMETKLSKYKLIKQGMMQNLLTGKIRLV